MERRKMRSRVYNRLSSRRREQLYTDLRSDVERMGVYRDIVDDAPDIIAIISPDVQSQVLYINNAVRCVLYFEPLGFLGSSFWDLVHTDDKTLLFKALTTVIFFKSATKVEPIRCRIQTRHPGVFVPVQMTLAYGTQGIVCILRQEESPPVILPLPGHSPAMSLPEPAL